jgi:hypothetical protein
MFQITYFFYYNIFQLHASNTKIFQLKQRIVVYLTSLCVNWAFFGTRLPILSYHLSGKNLQTNFDNKQ